MRLLFNAAVVVLCTALVACSAAPNSAGQISERIGQIANDPSTKELDLSKVTSFGWDKLHTFKAGTTRGEICKFLNAARNICGRVVRYDVVPAEHVALLFSLGHQLTHIELHALANGVFDVNIKEDGLAKSACVFKVRHVMSSTPTAYLEPK